MQLLKLCVFLLISTNITFARPFDTELTGNELLIDYEAMSSSAIPGIYAVDENNELKRVLVDGHYPLWLPDRQRFIFHRMDEEMMLSIYQANIKSHKSTIWSIPYILIDRLYIRPGYDELLFATPANAQGIPYDDTLDYPYINVGFHLRSERLSDGGLSKDLIILNTGTVKHFSFSSDGNKCVIENVDFSVPLSTQPFSLDIYQLKPDIMKDPNIIPSESWMEKTSTIDLMSLGDGIPCNPKWRPGKDFIVFEYVDKNTGFRKLCKLDKLTDKPEFIQLPSDWLSARIVDWSPDGSKLLVQYVKYYYEQQSYQLFSLGIIDSENLEVIDTLGVQSAVSCPIWSPDSKKIAYIDGQSENKFFDYFSNVVIFDINTLEVKNIDSPPKLIPVRLAW